MKSKLRGVATVAVVTALAGCASLPDEQGYAETGQLLQDRLGVAPPLPGKSGKAVEAAAEIPAEPLTVEQAVRLAFLQSPRMREEYARLGIGRAELEEARRISNPTFGYSNLDLRDGAGSKTTHSLSMSIADLLLLSTRKQFAAGELERLQSSVAADLLELAAEVEVAWYENVSAGQVAAMRDLVAVAAERSAELAQRYFDAGNINRLQLEQERASAAQARIDAVRASAIARKARARLATLIGLPVDTSWTTAQKLPAPPTVAYDADGLVAQALEDRLDLVAARKRVALLERAAEVTHRWRWLGTVEVGYERESEVDDSVLSGPTLSLQLPIFNQGQGAVERSGAELTESVARLDALAIEVENGVRVGLEHLAVSRDIAERYRTVLMPGREAIVARTQEQVNFMLIGVFELLVVKQQEYAAYQEYLEAVRDFWIARSELRRLVGGRLPDDGAALDLTIGVESVAPAEADHDHGDGS